MTSQTMKYTVPSTKYTPEHTRYGMPQNGVTLPATRYTTHEWTGSNANQYLTSSTERTSSQNLRLESERMRCEAADRTRRTQNDINVKLQDRIDNIVYWKTEVDRQLQKTDQEIANLMASKKQLEQAHVATQLPHEVATTCLKHREGRLSIDLVHDDVEVQLLKEVEMIENVQALLQQRILESDRQLSELRHCKSNLEADLKDKCTSFGLDSRCASLHNGSLGMSMHNAAVKIDPKSATPASYEHFSHENITNAEKERVSSCRQRELNEHTMHQTSNDLHKQAETVNESFRIRLQEMIIAKTNLEENLNQTILEIGSMNENIAALKEAIRLKDSPMRVAHMRLNTRAYRPNIELVRDPVQYGLCEEVAQITDSIEALTAKLNESNAKLRNLESNKKALEEDIAVKTNSLNIDQSQCLRLRKTLVWRSFRPANMFSASTVSHNKVPLVM